MPQLVGSIYINQNVVVKHFLTYQHYRGCACVESQNLLNPLVESVGKSRVGGQLQEEAINAGRSVVSE